MKHVIKDLAAVNAVSWGTIAEKIDENFSDLENSIPESGGSGGGGLDESQLGEYLTKNEYAKKSDIPSVPNKVSEFENDAKYVKESGLKTINGQSLLGSGNIVIEGGSGGASSGGSGAYAEVNHGTSDTTFTLTPNTFHVWDEVASLDLSFGAETSGVANEYLFQFTSGATATTLTLPSDIKWANEPTIVENMIYQISVLKGLASVLEFNNEASVFPATLVQEANGDLGVKVYGKLQEIAQGGSGTLSSGDLTLQLGSQNISVTSFFYVDSPYAGYVIYDTGMEYYILQTNGNVFYYFYD